MWSNQPDVWIDVSATVDRKIEALRDHESQLHDPAAVFERVRARMAEQGAVIGVAAAESYRLVVLDADPAEVEESSEVQEALAADESAPGSTGQAG
jgi:LmbE family N-acetylglucosaminyl deacetylase